MENSLYHRVSEIISNKKLAKDIFLLRIKDNFISRKAEPGNFVLIKAEGKILRRPFSIFDIRRGNYFEVLYKVVGSGTYRLSKLKSGENIDYIGPRGNCFNALDKKPVFFAGGIGVAPLYFLAKNFPLKGVFIYGVKNKDEFVKFSLKHKIIRISEEKDKKKVTDYLNLVKEDNVIYVAGHKEMIKKVLKKFENRGVKGFFSWEERMGCGIGLCRSCVIMTKQGYKRTCKEGPIFSFDEVDVNKL